MSEKQIRELAFAICDARRMLEIGDVEEAQCQLDRAAEIIPDAYWPTEEVQP
jgi:hypothetical protein